MVANRIVLSFFLVMLSCALQTQLAYGAPTMATLVAHKNLAKANQFMRHNALEKGVVTLPSGLQYKAVTMGMGGKPLPTDLVTVDYEGRHANGGVFDTSYNQDQPMTIPLPQLIAGWREALQLMPVGSTWMLYVPPELAYGEHGVPGVICSNEALVFKVHLIAAKRHMG